MTGHFLLFDYKRDMEKINKKQSCPFSNVMKLLGGKWDNNKKKWYTLSNNKNYDELINKYSSF